MQGNETVAASLAGLCYSYESVILAEKVIKTLNIAINKVTT